MNLFDFVDKLELDKKKLMLIFVVFVSLVYLDVAFIMGLQLSSIKAASEKISKFKNDIVSLTQDLAKMQKQDALQPRVLKIQKIITEKGLPYLLQDIDAIANKNKVNISQIKPSKESKAKDDKLSGKPQKLDTIMIAVDLTADYHHLGAFVNDLETAEELITVEELKIGQNPGGFLQQKANLLLKTYVKK